MLVAILTTTFLFLQFSISSVFHKVNANLNFKFELVCAQFGVQAMEDALLWRRKTLELHGSQVSHLVKKNIYKYSISVP